MSVAEKSVISAENAQTIFENQQRVHDAALSKGYQDGLSQGYEDGYDIGYTVGSIPILCLTKTEGIWQEAIFPENTELVLRFDKVRTPHQLFKNAKNIKSVKLVAPGSASYSLQEFIRGCETVEIIDFTEYNVKPTSIYMAFYFARKLKSILGALDLSECTITTYAFDGNNGLLEDIEFVPNTIKLSISFSAHKLLTNKSKQSIFDGLATVETAQTLTLHANLKILQSQVDSANAKGWTVVGGTVVSEEEYYG